MDSEFKPKWSLYVDLCDTTLQTGLIHISRTLEASDVLDRTLVPPALSVAYDEVLFGGALFSAELGELTQINTAFDVCFAALALWNNDGFLLLGPYIAAGAGEAAIDEILARCAIAASESEAYRAYYSSLPILSQEKISCMFAVIAQGLCGQRLVKGLSRIDITPESPSPCRVLEEDSVQVRAENIAMRYTMERELLNCIERGDFEAIEAMSYTRVNIIRVSNRLRNEKNQCLSLNTLARRCLGNVHIHPYFIDEISAKWAVRIEAAVSVEALSTLRRSMLYDYCRMVHTHSLSSYSANVRAMINYVQFNLSEKIALEEIALRLGVNASYLSQQFNKELGKSLPQYVAEKRVDEAKRLLRAPEDISVGQIGELTGFADNNYFTKTFKKHTGYTPSMYRSHEQASKKILL